MRAGRGAAEHAERRRRMPALGVLIEIHAQRKFALGFKAGDVGGDEIPAAGADFVGERKQCGQYRRRRMAAERVVAVVEIEGVRSGAVDQCGIECADAPRVAEYQCGSAAGTGGTQRDARAVFAGAGEGDADGVEDADLGPVHCFCRQGDIL